MVYFKFWFQYNQAVVWLNLIQLFNFSWTNQIADKIAMHFFSRLYQYLFTQLFALLFAVICLRKMDFSTVYYFNTNWWCEIRCLCDKTKWIVFCLETPFIFECAQKEPIKWKKQHNDNQTTITKHIVNQNYNEREQTARCRNRQMSIRFHPWVRQMCV